MFLLCAVKVPDGVTEMMMAEFQHQEAGQRINSILKFYTVWRFRYQVWPRMEEGAQQIFKVLLILHLVYMLSYRMQVTWPNRSKQMFLQHLVFASRLVCFVHLFDNILLMIILHMLLHRFLHPALILRCPLPSWACHVCPYLTLPGFRWMPAVFLMQSVKISP